MKPVSVVIVGDRAFVGLYVLFKPILGGDPGWGATGGASGFSAPTTF